MKKYLLLLFAAFAIVGCKQDILEHSEAEMAERMKDNLESGISSYDIVSFYVCNVREEMLLDVYEERYKSFILSLNDSGLSLKIGQLNNVGVQISQVFFYPYSNMLQVGFSEVKQLEGTARLSITLDAD